LAIDFNARKWYIVVNQRREKVKIVINAHYGGFFLTDEMVEELGLGEEIERYHYEDRADPKLVAAVEKLLPLGLCGDLAVVEIPDDVKWVIQEYESLIILPVRLCYFCRIRVAVKRVFVRSINKYVSSCNSCWR
jgi:hypothetical protein